ncbi:uncharacterized protein [Prorops nasuta]
MTCRTLYKIINRDYIIWKKKYFQRWPWMKTCPKIKCKLNKKSTLGWKKIWQQSMKPVRALKELINNKETSQLDLIYGRPFSHMELQKFYDLLDPQKGAPFMAFDLVRRELMEMQAIYYFYGHDYEIHVAQILRFIVKSHVAKIWRKIEKLPAKMQTMDKYGALTLQFVNRNRVISVESLSYQMKILARKTKKKLKESWPSHPIFSTPGKNFAYWAYHKIDDNQWDVRDSRQILNALCCTIFNEVCKRSVNKLNYTQEIILIEEDLKNCYKSPLHLAILFEGVGRRLGIRCSGVSCSWHFFIKWKDSYKDKSDSNIYYVDFFKGGRFLRKTYSPLEGTKIGEYSIHSKEDHFERYLIGATQLKSFWVNEVDFSNFNSTIAKLTSLLEMLTQIELPRDDEDILEIAKLYLKNKMVFWSLMTLITEATSEKQNTRQSEMYDVLEMFSSEIEIFKRYLVDFTDTRKFLL